MSTFSYGSVCSGIEAATVAWHPLGWHSAFFSEIESFPSAVLSHRHPNTPNLGDMTKFRDWPDYAISLLVGGTPCQSFSVAGLRKGLADPRGNLMLTYLAIAARYRPKWLVWENVPGVLSSNEGRDFGTFLGGLGELGYGFAYRVLDAQYVRVESHARAVPQRRRRVFVVGCFGDWRRAAAVLFERESLRGNTPPRRYQGQGTTPTLAARTRGGGGLGTDFDCGGGLVESAAAGTLNANGKAAGNATQQDAESGMLLAYGGNNTSGPIDVATACQAHGNCHPDVKPYGPHGRQDFGSETFVAHSLRADGFDASEDGTGRGTPLVAQTVTADMYRSGGAVAGNNDQGVRNCIVQPVAGPTAYNVQSQRSNAMQGDGDALAANPAEVARALDSAGFTTSQGGTVVAFSCKDHGADAGEVAPTLRGMGHDESHANGGGQIAVACFDERQVTSAANRGGDSHQLETREDGTANAVLTPNGGRAGIGVGAVATRTAVRRLTPKECERLQGFPDDYTAIPYRGKPACDGPRYKALGNSMAVNCMRWIGERIAKVDAL